MGKKLYQMLCFKTFNMKTKDKNFKTYYIKGFILFGVALLVIALAFALPFIIKDNDLITWVSLGIIFVGIIILVPSFILLKKGNNLRLDYLLSNKTNEKKFKSK